MMCLGGGRLMEKGDSYGKQKLRQVENEAVYVTGKTAEEPTSDNLR
jgi:hypothetical protein